MTAAWALLLLAAPSPSVNTVSGDMVCRVQHAIRHRNPAWSIDTCARVAEAANATFDPYLVMAVAVNESDLQELAFRKARRGVYDTGLMGIRCRLDRGQCTNWPVRGRRLEELLDPVVSIQAGEQLLRRKRQHDPKHWLRHYNGGTTEHGYAAQVSATKAALHGRRRLVESATVNKRTWQIVKAVLE